MSWTQWDPSGFFIRTSPDIDQGGVNFAADEAEHLLNLHMLGVCNTTGRIFSVGKVEVLDRYTDCTGFRCPCCKQRHDDRMGYTVLEPRRRR